MNEVDKPFDTLGFVAVWLVQLQSRPKGQSSEKEKTKKQTTYIYVSFFLRFFCWKSEMLVKTCQLATKWWRKYKACWFNWILNITVTCTSQATSRFSWWLWKCWQMASPNGAQIGFCFICLDRFGKVCTQTFCTSKSSCTKGAFKCGIFYPILFSKRPCL